MKKGRHRRFQQARALKQGPTGPLDHLLEEDDDGVDPELLAKWSDVAEQHQSSAAPTASSVSGEDDDEEAETA